MRKTLQSVEFTDDSETEIKMVWHYVHKGVVHERVEWWRGNDLTGESNISLGMIGETGPPGPSGMPGQQGCKEDWR